MIRRSLEQALQSVQSAHPDLRAAVYSPVRGVSSDREVHTYSNSLIALLLPRWLDGSA